MRSLRARLNTAFVVPTVAIVIALVAVGYVAARQGLEDELSKRLQAVAQVIAVDLSDDIDAAQIGRLDESMHRVQNRLQEHLVDAQQSTEVEQIVIFDEEARRLVDTDDETTFGDTVYRVEMDRSEVRTTFRDQEATTGPLFQTDDGEYHKMAYAPIVYEGDTVAAVGVKASATYFDLLRSFTTVLILLGTLGVAVVIAIGFWFSRLLVRPVDVLVEGAERLAEGDLETPVVARADRSWASVEEFDFLMDSFEEMRHSVVERDRQMQMMLGGIAHEVRNPLGGIELFCGLLKEDLHEALGEEDVQKKLQKLSRIEREVAYLEELVETFLDYAGSDELNRERIDARDFIDEICEVVERDVDEAGCRLEFEIEPGAELTVDPGRLRRALINVIRNACQACDQESSTVYIRCADGGDTSIVEVEDHGCGIGDDELEKLCKPFYTTREQGSGLGLALTHKVVDDHGGSLEIESEIGQGTTVRFRLPFDDDVTRHTDASGSHEIPDGWLG